MKKQKNKQGKRASKQAKKNNIQEQIITVKNAEGDADTTAEIVVQNQIDYAPKVSVIIPVYNVEQYLRQCLDSVVNQTLREIEIICVDDGSTDSSLDILKEYAAFDKRITVLKQENLHAGVARNAGLAVAKGEYLSFLDSDDFFELNMLEETYNKAIENDIDVLVYNAQEYDTQKGIYQSCIFPVSPSLFPQKDVCNAREFGEKLFQANSALAWNKLLRKKLVQQVNVKCSSTQSSNDVSLVYSVLASAERIQLYNKILVNYRINNPNSLQRSKSLSWECVCLAFSDLRQQLLRLNVYQYHKRSFINKALQSCLYYLNTITEPYKGEMASALKNKYFKLLDIEDYGEEYFYNKDFYKQFKLISSGKGYNLDVNQKKVPLIVSLTSYPKRISTVHETIKTILAQTKKANRIILWLANEQFPNKEKDLPKQLLDLKSQGLAINWYHDIRSFKKLIPTLINYPDAVVVTADDDAAYGKQWLQKLYDAYQKDKKSIHCHRARKIEKANNQLKPYSSWKFCKENEKEFSVFFTGVGGVLYPPNCLHRDVLNEEKFMRLCPQGDDIWFWAMALLNNVKIHCVEKAEMKTALIDGTQEEALYLSNVQGGKNDEQLHKVLAEYPEIMKKLDKTITKPEAAPKTIAEKAPAKPKTITEKSSAKPESKKYAVSYKIFKYIALYTHKKRGGNQVWKILGLPVWRKRKFTDNQTVKYYLLGVPLFEIAKIGSKF